MLSRRRNEQTSPSSPRRRRLGALVGAGVLASAFASAASPVAPSAMQQVVAVQDVTPAAAAEIPSRTLSFYNLHTEERLTVTYWRNGVYDDAAIGQITHLLRDHRRNEEQPVNRELLDYLYSIRLELAQNYRGNPMVYEVISGYRARETTDSLRRGGAAVANDTSQHQLGNALDFRIEGIPLRVLRDTAWCMQRGGVGYYPEAHNNFVHVDVGRVRFWPASRTRWACMR